MSQPENENVREIAAVLLILVVWLAWNILK
jgi:hypothetical protein